MGLSLLYKSIIEAYLRINPTRIIALRVNVDSVGLKKNYASAELIARFFATFRECSLNLSLSNSKLKYEFDVSSSFLD
jgi:hypothetical protein